MSNGHAGWALSLARDVWLQVTQEVMHLSTVAETFATDMLVRHVYAGACCWACQRCDIVCKFECACACVCVSLIHDLHV